jgi:hypothetical protein
MDSISTDRKLELDIQRELITFLQARGWHVERMLGNAYQSGIPDLFCYHKKWGMRWIEVKRPAGYSFTQRQRQRWPAWEKAGIGIWILTAATDEQHDLLFKSPNWRDFWRRSFAVPTIADIDAMLDELDREEESQASDRSQASDQSQVPDHLG